MKVKFFIVKGKNPVCQIYIRLWKSKQIDQKAKTGLTVLYTNWDKKNEKVRNKANATDKDFTNNKLLELKTFVNARFNEQYNNGEPIGAKWLKNAVEVFFNRATDKDPARIYLTEWVKIFIENAPKRLNKGKPISPNTIKKYVTAYNKLTAYENFIGKKIAFSDVTVNFYHDLVDYLRNELKLATNSAFSVITALKFFCGTIDFEGLEIPNHYKKFSVRREIPKDIYLTNDEIKRIFEYDFSDKPYLDNARDLLIIGLNTGLRVSDFMRLDLSHIEDDTIRIKALKTGKIAEIPINKQIADTLQKNGGNLPHHISEQKFNKYIKEIGRIVGIDNEVQGAKSMCVDENTKQYRKVQGTYKKWELITSHICRRSFATNLYGEVHNSVIMAITGHSTEKQFLQYIKKTATENAEILRNFYKQSAGQKGLKPALKVVS